LNRSIPIFFTKAHVGKESLYIGLLGFLLFTLGLWGQPFVEFDSRFALFAQEMWRHGPTLFPTTYGAPYPDYPATSTFFIWLCSLPFGGVTKLSAVLPTAIASALNLAITYRLLARFSRSWAFAAVCFECLTVNFLTEARSISLDQMVATVTLSGFYLAYTKSQEQNLWSLIHLALLLTLGFAIRGPLGVVIPAGVICSYYFLSSHWKHLLRFGILAAAVLLTCWFLLLALATHFYGADFTRDVIHMQVSGRMDQGDSPGHAYYFLSSFGNYALAYPLAVLVVALLVATQHQAFRKRSNDDAISLLLYFTAWILIVMAGLSIPDTKKIRYLLPMVPAIAALAAYPFHEGIDQGHTRVWIFFRKVLEKLFLVLPILALIALWEIFYYVHQHNIPVQLSFVLTATGLIVIQIMVVMLQWQTTKTLKTFSVLSGSVLTLWLLNVLIIEHATLQLHNTKKFVREVEALRNQQPGEIVFFRVGKDASAIKYLVNLDYDLQPQFLNDATELDALATKPAYIILQDEVLPLALQSARLQSLAPVLHDHFDHHDYTVFYFPAG